MYQISIFDLLEEEEDLESLTTEDMAKRIGPAIGVVFKPSGWEDQQEAKVTKKLRVSVHKSHYIVDTEEKEQGAAFIGVSWDFGSSEGGGKPADSFEEAIAFFKKIIERKGDLK